MDVLQVIAVATSVGALLISVSAHWSARQRASAEDTQKMEQRLTVLEQKANNAPSSIQVHELSLSIERLSGEIKVLGQQNKHTGEIISRIDQTLHRHEDQLDARPR